MSDNIVNVSDASFEAEVVNASEPVLVDFWAPWCGPCKMVSSALDQAAAELGDKVKIVKVNVDESPDTPAKYGVRGIPTLMVFQNSEIKANKTGAMSKAQMINFVEQSIS